MRIVTQEELDDAVVEKMFDFWGNRNGCSACLAMWSSNTGCTDACATSDGVTADGIAWMWHGVAGERPTPETIRVAPIHTTGQMECPYGHGWLIDAGDEAYAHRVHTRSATLAAAINGEYDEDTERARLVAVPA